MRKYRSTAQGLKDLKIEKQNKTGIIAIIHLV